MASQSEIGESKVQKVAFAHLLENFPGWNVVLGSNHEQKAWNTAIVRFICETGRTPQKIKRMRFIFIILNDKVRITLASRIN